MLRLDSIIGLWILRSCRTLHWSHLRDCFVVIIKYWVKLLYFSFKTSIISFVILYYSFFYITHKSLRHCSFQLERIEQITGFPQVCARSYLRINELISIPRFFVSSSSFPFFLFCGATVSSNSLALEHLEFIN